MRGKLQTSYTKIINALALMATLLTATNVHAEVVTLTFEGLEDFEYVSDYYNGGVGGNGSGPDTNYGVSFPGSTISYINEGPSGAYFNGQLTPGTALSFQQFGAWMNVASGFENTLSFYYGNINKDSLISIYSETNGGGKLLATLFLPVTDYVSLENGESRFDMVFASVSFNGVAKSVDFLSMAHRGYVDDLTIFTSPVPEPGTYVMLAMGLVLFGVFLRRSPHENNHVV